jgi:asparagine synthase (glutamine-hydrolysing)
VVCRTRQHGSGRPGRARRLKWSRSPQQVTVRLGEIVFCPITSSICLATGWKWRTRFEGRVPFLDHHVVECVGRAGVVENPRRDREIFAPGSGQAADHRDRVPPAKAPLSLAAGDHGSNRPVPSNDAGHTPRSVLASLPFYDQKKVVALLDQLPAMSDWDRMGWDPVLMFVLSACVLRERFGLGSKTADSAAVLN